MKIDQAKGFQSVGTVANDGKRAVIDRPVSEKFANYLAEADQTRAARAKAISPMTGALPMIAVEMVGDALERRKKAQKRGRHILSKLDNLRHALLTGQLTQSQIEELIASLATEKSHIDDADLLALLDEIDLRAQVELAKYQSKNE